MAVNPIPEGFHTVTPYLQVADAGGLIDFVKKAFQAEVFERMEGENGRVMHAQVRIGDSMIMMGEAMGDCSRMPAMLYLYVPDVDQGHEDALQAGGESIQEPVNMFYGDRSAAVKDAFGNSWWIGTHVEDVSREELQRRATELENQ